MVTDYILILINIDINYCLMKYGHMTGSITYLFPFQSWRIQHHFPWKYSFAFYKEPSVKLRAPYLQQRVSWAVHRWPWDRTGRRDLTASACKTHSRGGHLSEVLKLTSYFPVGHPDVMTEKCILYVFMCLGNQIDSG